MADLQRLSELEERDHCRIAASALKVAQVLLTEARTRFDVLLSQAFLPTQPSEIPTDQFAHVHAQSVAHLRTISVSTIVCIWTPCSHNNDGFLRMTPDQISRRTAVRQDAA